MTADEFSKLPPVSDPVAEPARRRKKLIGRGGVGLVTFYLAREQVEFALTYDDAVTGDVWVYVSGERRGIEVKTSAVHRRWVVKKSQLLMVDFYVFAQLQSGACFVLTIDELNLIVLKSRERYPGFAQVDADDFPTDALNGWHRITGNHVDRLSRPLLSNRGVLKPPVTGKPSAQTGLNTVTRRLRDGTVLYTFYHRPTGNRIGSSSEGWTREKARNAARTWHRRNPSKDDQR